MMETPETPRIAPARWSAEEEARLLEAWDKAATMQDLALNHGRSVGAIESRLVQLGAIGYAPYDDLIGEEKPEKLGDETAYTMMGKPWVDADVAALLTAHTLAKQASAPLDEMKRTAETLQRTPRALVLKLVALGALVPTRVHPLQRRAKKGCASGCYKEGRTTCSARQKAKHYRYRRVPNRFASVA